MIACSKLTVFVPPSPSTSSWLTASEAAVAADDRDLALLGEARQAAGQLLDHAVLPAAQLVDVDRRLGEADAVAAMSLVSSITLAACSSALDGMQPTLRQTPPRRRPALDQHHLLAEVGGAERGGVAAGTGAEHQHLGVVVALRGDGRLGRRRARGRAVLRRRRRAVPAWPCRRAGSADAPGLPA